jgi:histidine ammonia-lyase
MATFGARRLMDMCFNTSVVVGIEAMAAAQGIEFNRPLQSSAILEQQWHAIRQRVAFLERDRLLAPDIEAMRLWVAESSLPQDVQSLLPSYPTPL